jgi:hypothetical protein
MNPRQDQPYISLFMKHILRTGPCSAQDLSVAFSLSPRNVREYCKLLHEDKKIYICSYIQKHRGAAVPVYALNPLGDLEDIEYPKPVTMAEAQRRHRIRVKLAKGESVCQK